MKNDLDNISYAIIFGENNKNYIIMSVKSIMLAV